MVSSVGDPLAVDRGKLLRLPEIMERTGMAEGTVRSRYHAGTFDVLWKFGRRLVVWERDLEAWLDAQRAATRKTPQAVNWAGPFRDLLASLPELELAQRAFVRERVIRQMMAETGESREIVVEAVDAADSMDQEAVLDLVDGDPTTLRGALQKYADNVEQAASEGETASAESVYNDITAILNYPFPQGDGQSGHTLEIDDESEDEVLVIKVDGREIYRANHDEHGYAGMGAAHEAATAVFRRLSE